MRNRRIWLGLYGKKKFLPTWSYSQWLWCCGCLPPLVNALLWTARTTVWVWQATRLPTSCVSTMNGECCKQFSGLSLAFSAVLATRLGQPVCYSLQLEENPANYDGRFVGVIQYVFLSWCIVLDFQYVTFTFPASELVDVPFMYGLREGNAVHVIATSVCPSSLQDVARAARCLVSQTKVRRTQHAEGTYPHVQGMQRLEPGDFAQRLEFCSCLSGNRRLHNYTLLTDEVQFCDGCQ